MTDGRGSPPIQVLYILGSQRGGTTILGRVLGTIDGCAFAGELRNFWSAGSKVCGCGKPHAECEVWSQVHRRMPGRSREEAIDLRRRSAPDAHSWWHVRRLLRGNEPFPDESVEARYGRLMVELYREYAAASGARVIIDSSKHPAEAALLRRTPGISLVCVQIVRDPRGAIFDGELRRLSRRPDAPGGHPDGRGTRDRPHPLGTTHAALAWVGRHRASEAVRRRSAEGRSLLIRYEDFCADPERTVRAVSGLVGLPGRWPGLRPDGTIPLPTAHTPAGSGRRRAADVALAEDRRWAAEDHPLDRLVATILTVPWLVRYGYPIPPRRSPGTTAGERAAP